MSDSGQYVGQAERFPTAFTAAFALVFQEALGVNLQMRGVADRYAKLGFVAVAPDLFHRVRPG